MYDSRLSPSCRIDGGQILVRRSVLAAIEEPWCPEGLTDCNTADGALMNKIAQVTPIWPVVGSWVMENRMTPESAHWRLVDGVPRMVTGETQARLRGE